MTITQPHTIKNEHSDDYYLVVENVHKSFGAFKILKNIKLLCKKGELICLLGPSGCGKTTLLRIIAGLESQDSGTIIQDNKNISNLPVQQRDFGIVFQSYALFPNLTVEKNVGYGLNKHPNKAARIKELLEMVELEEHAKKYPSQISGGQQQRVALARALAIEPNLLLLDEPLSALDAKVREYLRQEIKQLQQRLGVTTLMVTHDQEEAMSMADKIVVMNAGYIEQVGSPHEVYTNPATPFVANFVGSMNFIPATIINNEQTSNTVECLGQRFTCSAHDKTSHEEKAMVNLGIRPEHIVLSGDLTIADAFVVTVDKIEFLGAFVRIFTIHEASGQKILVDVSNEQFVLEQLKAGMQLSLRFKEQHIRVYAATSDDAEVNVQGVG